MRLQMLFPNLNVPSNRAWFETGLHGRQVDLFPIIRDEGAFGCLWFRPANGHHVLIAQCKHSGAGYRIVLGIAVTQLMGNPLLLTVFSLDEVAHEEAVA